MAPLVLTCICATVRSPVLTAADTDTFSITSSLPAGTENWALQLLLAAAITQLVLTAKGLRAGLSTSRTRTGLVAALPTCTVGVPVIPTFHAPLCVAATVPETPNEPWTGSGNCVGSIVTVGPPAARTVDC